MLMINSRCFNSLATSVSCTKARSLVKTCWISTTFILVAWEARVTMIIASSQNKVLKQTSKDRKFEMF